MSMKHFIITMQYECDAEHEDAAREHIWDVFKNAPIGACQIDIRLSEWQPHEEQASVASHSRTPASAGTTVGNPLLHGRLH